MNLESKTFRSRFSRSLEISRPRIIQVGNKRITSTPLIQDHLNLIENSPLFPFTLQFHGEIQGFIFFTSTHKKIPFSQSELLNYLKRYFYFFGEKIEDQTRFMISMSEARTPDLEKLSRLLKPFHATDKSYFFKQNILINDTSSLDFSLQALFAIAPRNKEYLDV